MLTIGQASAATGVEAHVLRHWEDVGVLVPQRAGSGHRRYSTDDLDTARLVRRAQRTGMSLPQIRVLLHASRAEREAVVAERIAALRDAVAEATSTIDFLEHTRACRHRLVAVCDDCRRYARA